MGKNTAPPQRMLRRGNCSLPMPLAEPRAGPATDRSLGLKARMTAVGRIETAKIDSPRSRTAALEAIIRPT